MKGKMTVQYVLWVYMILLGLIIIATMGILSLYGSVATTAKTLTDAEAHKSAVENIGTLAQSFSDLVKVIVGAVIGALSVALQSLSSGKNDQPSAKTDESKRDDQTKDVVEN